MTTPPSFRGLHHAQLNVFHMDAVGNEKHNQERNNARGPECISKVSASQEQELTYASILRLLDSTHLSINAAARS